MWLPSDVPTGVLTGLSISVMGYGNQGRAQALNLRDRGLPVQVGNIDDEYAASARADGFRVLRIRQAVEAADIVLVLIPDEVQPHVFRSSISNALRPGQVVSFASGYNVTYGRVPIRDDVDVILVAPRMIGRGVRELFLSNRGFPMLVGVEQDASDEALARAVALAGTVGADREGGCVLESSFKEETLLDLFSEHAGLIQLLKTSCEVLIEAGCSPEAAILETYGSGELGEIARAIADLGLVNQLRLHSTTSQFGQLVWGRRWIAIETRDLMRRAVASIQDGTFARAWHAEQQAGHVQLHAAWRQQEMAPLFLAEARLYEALGRGGE